MFSCILLISVLLSNHGLALSERKYHIIPSLGDVCPQDPCLTLSQFAENASIYIDSNRTNTAVTLIFTTGTHSFNYGSLVLIENVDTISMFSNASSLVSSLWIGFISVANVFINNLTFVHCNFHFDTVETLAVENSTFLNNTLTLLELEQANAYIANSRFISNSGGPARLTINGSSQLYSAGAVVIMRSLSTFVCKNCSFHQSIAEVGGVIYARLNSNLTFIDCSFVSNHVRKFGGVFYTENFCTVSIQNSSFHNNSALLMAGVLAANSTTIAIHHSTFTNNNAGQNGGVMHIDSSHITVSESMFSNCTAYNGGALATFGSTILIQESVFRHNKANDNGGVIYAVKKHNDQHYIRITESEFVNNSAQIGGVLLSEGINVSFIDCRRIENNRAGIGGVMWTINVDWTLIYGSVLCNNTAELAGGALTLSSNLNTNISHSQLIGNSVDEYGGAIYMEKSNVTISNCNFDSNRAAETGGAISVQVASHFEISTSIIRNNFAQYGAGIFCSDKSVVTTSNITATQNNATKQGILYFIESNVTFTHSTNISDNVGSLFFFYSNVAFRDTTIVDSGTSNEHELTTTEGGAVTAFLSIVNLEGLTILRDNSASKGGAIHATSSKLYIHGNTLVSNNSALDSGGSIYLYQSELNCAGNSSLELLGNDAADRGGGIHAISSTITAEYRFATSAHIDPPYVGSKIKLINNRAAWVGGGICLENNAKIKVLNLEKGGVLVKVYTVEFYGNLAEYGGALYVADNTTSGTCASTSYQIHSTLTECFLQIPQLLSISLYLTIKKHTHIEFINNHAVMRGSNLYGGLLDRCTQNPLNEVEITHPNTTNGLQYLMEFSNINSSDSISSDPVRVCFCQNYKPDCTYQPPTINVTKGGRFGVSLVAVDQASHMISAVIHGFPVSDESGISEGQLIQAAADECTNLTYNVFSPHSNDILIIYADGPCKDAPLSQRRIQIKFLPCTCPIGFQPDLQDEIRCVCECDSKLKGYITRCDFEAQSLVRQGQPWISYVQTVPANFSDFLIYPYCPLNYCKDNAEVNLNTQNGIDAQCAAFRTGTLCGACQPNYSLSLGSTHCIKCPSYWPTISVFVLVALFLAGLALVALILVLNLTVAVGTLNGIIFYANIVYANIHTFHPDSQSSFATVFVSWLNLDIGIDTCFIKGMDAYWKTWLQLIFPSYVFFLVLMVIIISNRSRRFSELISKKNPVATLATLILLSYAKFLHIIITAFSSATLNYPGPSGGYKRKVWLPDATTDYLNGKHVPLFLAALFILLAGIVYTTLIFSWQWLQRFNKGKVLKWTRNPKVSGFIEIYHIPNTPQNRYWTGLLLFVRVILYIASAANVSGDPKINLLIIGSVITGVLLVNKVVGIGNRVYKRWPIEVLEVASYVNLLLLSLATFFSLENIRARKVVTNVSVSITFLLLLGVLFYHVFTELIVKRWKIANREIQSSVEQSEGVSDPGESFQMSTTTISMVDAPKKILCTNYTNDELREALLDRNDD